MARGHAPHAHAALLEALNPAQRDAVTTVEGPLLVLAGAGTGKTRVITTRIAHLVSLGVPPASILAVTFTNKAAGEMRERVVQLAGERAREITVGTFHAFCARVLREHGHVLGLSRKFTICDASDQQSAVKSAMRELRMHETTMHPSAVLARISLGKSRMETPEAFLAQGSGGRDQLVGSVWQRYRDYLGRTRALDFDDLLLETVRLLREHEEVRAHYRRRYRHVLVDEYQDTNAPQYEIVREIGGEHRNVCVVGDDDQSIYGWRGADIRKILGFPRDFEGARIVRLETNYRSTRPILEAANAVIRGNASRHDKALHSSRGDGEPVRFLRLKDETTEAQFAVEAMRKLLRLDEAQPADFAVLCRTQVQFRPFEAELRANGIPYVVVGGMSFFDGRVAGITVERRWTCPNLDPMGRQDPTSLSLHSDPQEPVRSGNRRGLTLLAALAFALLVGLGWLAYHLLGRTEHLEREVASLRAEARESEARSQEAMERAVQAEASASRSGGTAVGGGADDHCAGGGRGRAYRRHQHPRRSGSRAGRGGPYPQAG